MKNGAGRPYMASVMCICGGLVGPRSGNVGFCIGFNKCFFAAPRGACGRKPGQNGLHLGRFGVQEVRLLNKTALCLALELCFPQQREAYFQKNH